MNKKSFLFTERELKLINQYIETGQETQATTELIEKIIEHLPRLLDEFDLCFLVKKRLEALNRWDTDTEPKKHNKKQLKKGPKQSPN